jgi:hypothetical protein
VALAVGSVLVVGLAVGSIWIANYEPLVQGSLGFGTLRRDVKEVDVDAFDMRGTVFTVPTGRTATFRYRFSILNGGPVAVKINDIGSPPGDGDLTRHAIRVIPDVWADDGVIGPPPEEPWHPFMLRPGGEAVVVMEAAYDGRCMHRADDVSWYWEPISFSILGVSRHAYLESGVEVRFTGDRSCRKS